DGNGAAVVNFLQPSDDTRKINLSFAYGNFLAEFSRVGGPEAVFGVDALDVRREDFNCVDRIGLAVHDDVGDINVAALIVEADIAHGAHERDGSFLAGFVAEVLAVAVAVLSDFAHGVNRFLVDRVVGIFGDEAGVGLQRGNVTAGGKIGGGFDVGDAC